MTVTDMSLAEPVAKEHRGVYREPRHYVCACDNYETARDVRAHELHIATVTERAVRARIEEDISATWEAFDLPLPVNTFPASEQKAYRFGYLWAARIARGEGQ